ncbi:hypothetical protein, partial [Salmonella enterica]|uniref:hypothetical protein n=1 Tax=Salmonella enterica TaxID=28901 RepID=UPI0021B40AFF
MPPIATPARRPLTLHRLALALSLALSVPVLHAEDTPTAPDTAQVKNLESVQATATVTGDGDSYTTKA